MVILKYHRFLLQMYEHKREFIILFEISLSRIRNIGTLCVLATLDTIWACA